MKTAHLLDHCQSNIKSKHIRFYSQISLNPELHRKQPPKFYKQIRSYRVATHRNKKNARLFTDCEAIFTDLAGWLFWPKSTKIRMAQITLKQNCNVYMKTSNKIICGNVKIKFPDFSLTLNRDLEIPWPNTVQNSLTFHWPWIKSNFPWLFPDCGNPELQWQY